jgi:hypothetical protein
METTQFRPEKIQTSTGLFPVLSRLSITMGDTCPLCGVGTGSESHNGDRSRIWFGRRCLLALPGY